MKYAYTCCRDELGKKFWTRVGQVYEGVNLVIKLDVLPINGEIHILDDDVVKTWTSDMGPDFNKEELYSMFHDVWGMAKDSPDYDKEVLKSMQREIEKLFEK